jgi:molecular chaperone HscB
VDFRQNYFELFGLPVGFEVDIKALTARYRDLQKALHPDRFANAPDQERRLSLQQAAQINSGYETLRDPLARARYLLELQGVAYNSESSTISDPEFLEEQMELRERLAEIRHDDDPSEALGSFMAQLDIRSREYVEALRVVFAQRPTADAAKAKNLVQRMQFIRRLQQEAEALEEELL